MIGFGHDPAIAAEAGPVEAVPGSRQCQVYSTDHCVRTQEELRRVREFAERCPNQAEALIWLSCANGHEYPEEVCAGHTDPPGNQWCGYCAADGLSVFITLTVIGWI
jgi:hypothetical protein